MRIGIITHYYKSQNYGGNLQAYALCKVIESLGFEAQQISFHRKKCSSLFGKNHGFGYSILKKLYRKFSSCIERTAADIRHNDLNTNFRMRAEAILGFNLNSIPHSEIIFTEENIRDSVQQYDVFITGSDQVWHPTAVCEAYLLDFVDGTSNSKFSYAASISVHVLMAQQLSRYKQSLADYQAVSVREKRAVELLQPVTGLDVQQTLDPTLLLEIEEWDQIASERIPKDNYIFCYFLGDDIDHRRITEKFAETHQLKIVTLPYLIGKFRKCDEYFGDEQLYDVSPADFISLIKYADYIFTDSFHASVFSLLYQKEFFIFERSSQQSMSSRLYSLTELFDIQNHFCDMQEKLSLQYINSLNRIDYNRCFAEFERMKEMSFAFLKNNLEIAENKLNKL